MRKRKDLPHKLNPQDREALEKAKQDLIELIDDYVDSLIVLGDVKKFHSFTSHLKNFFENQKNRKST